MLFFILQNKRLFLLFIKTDDRKVFKNMVGVIKSNISRHARVHRNSEKIFAVYTSEVVELLECWGKNGFPEDDLTSVLNDIMYLTDTMRPRLFPIYKPKS